LKFDCDVLVIGGGPAGLMAAVTATSAGYKVLLVERKKQLTKISRTCAQTFFSADSGLGNRFYAEPAYVESAGNGCQFVCPSIGMRVEYSGLLIPSYQMVYLSPSGYQVKRFPDDRDRPWAWIFNKSELLAGLQVKAAGSGVEMMVGTAALFVTNTNTGVEAVVSSNGIERKLSARTAIAADGLNSIIVDRLGLNQRRRDVGKPVSGAQWILEGFKHDLKAGTNSCLVVSYPSFGVGSVMIGPYPEAGKEGITSLIVTHNGEKFLHDLRNLPLYAPWFENSRLIRRTAFASHSRTAITIPVTGNILVIGDAAAAYETLVIGALACGLRAGVAVKGFLDGDGYRSYIHWWTKAFHYFEEGYYHHKSEAVPLAAFCTDGDLDYIYHLLSSRTGDPAILVRSVSETIRLDRPDLYSKMMSYLN
jgi:flavin-dependent dehydrogenase